MLEKHLKHVNKKLFKLSIIYAILLLIFGSLIFIFKGNVAPIVMFVIILYFAIASMYRYLMYLKWIKKQGKNNKFAIIHFKSHPHLFFKDYDGITLPLKQFALPLNKHIEVIILDRINTITTVLHESTEGDYDLVITISHEVHLHRISD